ncbi:MAG: hypothetical protein IIY55_05010, partial [Blautia sp.]|nr:hypothetical protein [Blautia sp.]
MAAPDGRNRRVTGNGKGVHKRGEGLGTGPVGDQSGYAGRTGGNSGKGTRPGSSGSPLGAGSRPGSGAGNHSGSRPQGSSGGNYSGGSSHSSGGNFSGGGSHSGGSFSGGGSRGSGGGGLGKLIPVLILAAIVLFGGGNLSGLLGGGSGSNTGGSSSGSNANSGSYNSSTNTGNNSSHSNYPALNNSSQNGGSSSYGSGSSAGSFGSAQDITALLSALLGSGASQSVTGTYNTPASASNTINLDTAVASGARKKLTTIKGNNKDTVTLMVYMCGTDLESKGGMASSDLREMAGARLSDKVNIIVYTGGCSGWKIKGISARTNQIYKVENNSLTCLVDDDGSKCMTDPDTLTSFIKYCARNYPANRNQLIFWDHGGGSASGYGYDQKFPSKGSMGLSQIKSAVKNSGVTFDFIGFDACLMATVETALALSDYADYMIASEETEPGTGWYYTNWLTDLSANTSMPTTSIGKEIVDDFIDTSARQCRGQSTTLSIVDLAELSATLPSKLTAFAKNTNEMIAANQASQIYTARNNSREFAQSSHISQFDLVSLCRNLGTASAEALSKTILSAVKYNRTSSNMAGSYGLSIYFPGKNASRTASSMVSTYNALGLDSEYTKCIQKLASTQQAAFSVSGGSHNPFGSLTGSSSSNGGDLYGSLFGSDGGEILAEMLGALLSGGRMAGLDTATDADLFSSSDISLEELEGNLRGNLFDPSVLVWEYKDSEPVLKLSAEDWSRIQTVRMHMFFNDGEGYVDLGLDNSYLVSEDGTLTPYTDGAWISIDGQPVAYYHLYTCVDNEAGTFTTIGRVPCLLNKERANLLVVFDTENPDGYVA